jgi:hypothetical protein
MTKRDIAGWETEAPELDAFLADYAAICRKHGMEFEQGYYDCDGGGGYVTLSRYSGGDGPYLALDKADPELPFVKRAKAEREAKREADRRKEKNKKDPLHAIVSEIAKYPQAHIVGTDGCDSGLVIIVRPENMSPANPLYGYIPLSGLEMLRDAQSMRDLAEGRVRRAMSTIGLV